MAAVCVWPFLLQNLIPQGLFTIEKEQEALEGRMVVSVSMLRNTTCNRVRATKLLVLMVAQVQAEVFPLSDLPSSGEI